jgi:hypothetical protein
LLQTLREGLELVSVTGDAQSTAIKVLTDTLAQAFMSKTAAIPTERIEAMAKRLAELEKYISEDGKLDDMPLSSESIELMLGVDAGDLNVIANTDSPVEPAMLEWASRWKAVAGSRWTTTVPVCRCNMSGIAVASICICSPRWMDTAICCRRSAGDLSAGRLARGA